ncbi:MAG: AAC(3)-I family aminoglycoside N-acetyltransferase [Bacteroidota bacterium]
MADPARVRVHELTAHEVPLMHGLLTLFDEAFQDPETYTSNRPSRAYLERLLGTDSFVALAALDGDAVVGGLVAYEFVKFEQERSEFYIYDLAVAASHRRQGIATTLIEAMRTIAANRGAYVVFIQADADNAPAIATYARLGVREDAAHFDIPVAPSASLSDSAA